MFSNNSMSMEQQRELQNRLLMLHGLQFDNVSSSATGADNPTEQENLESAQPGKFNMDTKDNTGGFLDGDTRMNNTPSTQLMDCDSDVKLEFLSASIEYPKQEPSVHDTPSPKQLDVKQFPQIQRAIRRQNSTSSLNNLPQSPSLLRPHTLREKGSHRKTKSSGTISAFGVSLRQGLPPSPLALNSESKDGEYFSTHPTTASRLHQPIAMYKESQSYNFALKQHRGHKRAMSHTVPLLPVSQASLVFENSPRLNLAIPSTVSMNPCFGHRRSFSSGMRGTPELLSPITNYGLTSSSNVSLRSTSSGPVTPGDYGYFDTNFVRKESAYFDQNDYFQAMQGKGLYSPVDPSQVQLRATMPTFIMTTTDDSNDIKTPIENFNDFIINTTMTSPQNIPPQTLNGPLNLLMMPNSEETNELKTPIEKLNNFMINDVTPPRQTIPFPTFAEPITPISSQGDFHLPLDGISPQAISMQNNTVTPLIQNFNVMNIQPNFGMQHLGTFNSNPMAMELSPESGMMDFQNGGMEYGLQPFYAAEPEIRPTDNDSDVSDASDEIIDYNEYANQFPNAIREIQPTPDEALDFSLFAKRYPNTIREIQMRVREINRDQIVDDTLYVCRWDEGKECGTKYDNMKEYVDHVGMHFGTKKSSYTCHWVGCDRNGTPFSKRCKIENHVRKHTGEKPFTCTFPNCNRNFARKDGLSAHTKTHCDVKPFVCAVDGCNREYVHSRSLRKHMKNVHPHIKVEE
ncbi:hypothetical protein HK098_000598 [Nowakowskiella sp. JEL0407]|nr:hypothetical protein HK098_000588 [Nowakowskiella sp. JEL0407]KAJ3125106.1 hypothetical protein HK098_000598 [Nowakowskiella sp. JEL0407]